MRFMLYLLYFGGALVWLFVTYGDLVDERTCVDDVDRGEDRTNKLQQRALRVVGFPLWFCWVARWGAGEIRRLLREISGRSR